MHTVTAGAVRNRNIPRLPRQAVITVRERLEPVRRESIFAGQFDGSVAGGADLGREVFRRCRGSGVRRREDIVFAVAICACRRCSDARCKRCSVDASPVLLEDVAVTLPAGPRDIRPGNLRVGPRPFFHLMGAVAINAGRGGIVAALQCARMDAIAVARDEPGRGTRSGPHVRVVKMTPETHRRDFQTAGLHG